MIDTVSLPKTSLPPTTSARYISDLGHLYTAHGDTNVRLNQAYRKGWQRALLQLTVAGSYVLAGLLLLAIIFGGARLHAQSQTLPFNVQQMNNTLYVGPVGPGSYATIQSAVSYGCNSTKSPQWRVEIMPGATPTDSPTTVTGCSKVFISDTRVGNGSKYTWNGSAFIAVPSGGGGSVGQLHEIPANASPTTNAGTGMYTDQQHGLIAAKLASTVQDNAVQSINPGFPYVGVNQQIDSTVTKRRSYSDGATQQIRNMYLYGGGADEAILELTGWSYDLFNAIIATQTQGGGSHQERGQQNSWGDYVSHQENKLCNGIDEGFNEGCEKLRDWVALNYLVFGGALQLESVDDVGQQHLQVNISNGRENEAAGEGNFLVNVTKGVTPPGNVMLVTRQPGIGAQLTLDSTLAAWVHTKFGNVDTTVRTLTAPIDDKHYSTTCPSTVIAPNWGMDADGFYINPFNQNSDGTGNLTRHFCFQVDSTAGWSTGTKVAFFGPDGNPEIVQLQLVADGTHAVANFNRPHRSGETARSGAGVGYAVGSPHDIYAPGSLPTTPDIQQTANLMVGYPIMGIFGNTVQLWNYPAAGGDLNMNLYEGSTPNTPATVATATASGGVLTGLTFNTNNYNVSTYGSATGAIRFLPPPTITTNCTVQPTFGFYLADALMYQPTILTGGSGCPSSPTVTLNSTPENQITFYPMTRVIHVADQNAQLTGETLVQPLASAQDAWVDTDDVQQLFNPNVFMASLEGTFGSPTVVRSSRVGSFVTKIYTNPTAPPMEFDNRTPDDSYDGVPSSAGNRRAGQGTTQPLMRADGRWGGLAVFDSPPVETDGTGFVQPGHLFSFGCSQRQGTPLCSNPFDLIVDNYSTGGLKLMRWQPFGIPELQLVGLGLYTDHKITTTQQLEALTYLYSHDLEVCAGGAEKILSTNGGHVACASPSALAAVVPGGAALLKFGVGTDTPDAWNGVSAVGGSDFQVKNGGSARVIINGGSGSAGNPELHIVQMGASSGYRNFRMTGLTNGHFQFDAPSDDYSATTLLMDCSHEGICGMPQNVRTPASSTDNGEPGQWADDATYHYACIAHNTWVRVPWATGSW